MSRGAARDWPSRQPSSLFASRTLSPSRKSPPARCLSGVRRWPPLGLNHVRASLDSADPAREPATRRRTGVLLASRNLLSGTTAKLGLPWSENAISGTTAADSYRVEVLCVHVPNAANGWVKVETLQAIRTSLASAPPGPPGIARKREHFPTGKLPAWDVQVSAENSGTPKAGSRKRVGCGRTRSSGPSGTRLPRRFPSPERLCQTGTQLDVAAHRWP